MKKVLLSFDLEEFDVPAEHGINLSMEEQISISLEGTENILQILSDFKIRATFFTTVVFAERARDVIQRIISEGHEVGSHGWYHSSFTDKHLVESRKALKELFGVDVRGFRMARMMKVNSDSVREAGYEYNSSLNPVYLPGRYNNFFEKRTKSVVHSVHQIPASATPILRIPLFWLTFHHMPLWIYKLACARTMNHDHYLNLYFHPWEFTDLNQLVPGLPRLITKNTGTTMVQRFKDLLAWMTAAGYNIGPIESII